MRMARTAVMLLALSAPAFAAGAPFTGEIGLVLEDAVFQAVDADGTRFHGLDEEIPAVWPKPLVLDLACVTGRWDRVWGVALSLNQADHRGRVLKADVAPGRIRLTVQMKIEGDPWVAGGRGEYAIDLRRDGSRLKGAYAGLYRGRDVKGLVTGEILPARPPFPAGFVPAAPGERPRMLFRRSDLPRLREKAETSFGRRLVGIMKGSPDDPVAMGVLWQLEGDPSWAEQAASAADRLIARGGQAGPFNLPHAVGERLEAVALAYDLCADTWAPEVRSRVLGYLMLYAERTILRPQNLSRKMNFSPSSNYHAAVRGGGAMAGLAFWGERGPEPPRPSDPGTEAVPVVSPEEFQPGDGVPVVAFDPGRSPDRWLLLGPFPFIATEDILKPLGGSAAARPVDGTEVFCRGESRAFKPLAARFIDASRGGVDVRRLLEGTTGSTLHLYTVIETARPVLVRFAAGHPNATVHLSGRRLDDDDFLEIGPGRHPLMVRFAIGMPWGVVRPRFAPVTAERVWKVLAARQSEYRASLEDWREDQAVWERTGGFHPHLMRLFKLGERQMARYYHYALGDGGWQTEGEAYTLHSCPVALAYAHAYRTMFGRLPSPRPDITRFAPRYVMQAVFRGDGKRPIALSDSLSDGTLEPRHYARVFSVTEPSYRPAVLWAWDRRLDVVDGGESGAVVEDDIWAMASTRAGEGQDAAFALVNRPLDLEPRNPAGILPLTWAAPTRGGYIFRDGWKGADDIVAQVYLKALPPNGLGRPTAGTIRLCGLGHVWGDDGAGNPQTGCRWLENVVLLPDDPINEGLGARLTHRETRPDGSGVIAFDLDEVYAGAKWVRDAEGGERPARLTDQMYRVLRENLADLGIDGMRSVAVDYGGSGGVPALLAVVDRVTGGGRKIWLWQVPGREREKPEVTIDGCAFTFRHGDVSLRATFVVPADVSLERVRGERRVHLPNGGTGEVMLDAVQATGPEVTAGDYFVVMTLQRGPAPEVKVEGEGLRAKVRIGRQVVAFDGRKLVLVNDGK